MILLSDKARGMLEDFFKKNERKPVRVYAVSGCHGPTLAMALDNAREDADEVEEKGGFTFCMDKGLKALVRQVEIDAGSTGFTCTPLVPLPNTGSGCSSCGGGCGCR